MRANVKLDLIGPNPYQGRDSIDSEYIQDLADDIQRHRTSHPETLGLLQIPGGRVVDVDGDPVAIPRSAWNETLTALAEGWLRVQLAYGHSRLAAFEVLHKREPELWPHLPVELGEYDDQAMATTAWSENSQRKDLTVYERGRMLQRLMEQFKWTQTEIAGRLGMSQPQVSNALRILRLPEDMAEAIQEREISERQAVALLPLVEMPAEVVDNLQTWTRRDYEKARNNYKDMSSDQIRETVQNLTRNGTENLEKACFPLAWQHVGEKTRALQCEGCERNQRDRCYDPTCYRVRSYAYKVECLSSASVALGYPWLDPEDSDRRNMDYFWSGAKGQATLKQALENKCENLRIAWRWGWQFDRPSGTEPAHEDHPTVQFVCSHEGRGCRCAGHGLSKAEATEVLRQKAEATQTLKLLRQKAREQLGEALGNNEPWAWRMVARWAVPHYQREGIETWPIERCIARVVTQVVANFQYWQPERVEENRQEWERMVNEYGAAPGDATVSAEVEASEKLNRIRIWIRRSSKDLPNSEALQGNIDNLAKIEIPYTPEDGDATGKILIGIIKAESERLQELAAIRERWDGEGFDNVSWLVNTPPEDINFKSNLARAPSEAIEWALALVKGVEGNKTRRARLRAALRKRGKEA